MLGVCLHFDKGDPSVHVETSTFFFNVVINFWELSFLWIINYFVNMPLKIDLGYYYALFMWIKVSDDLLFFLHSQDFNASTLFYIYVDSGCNAW